MNNKKDALKNINQMAKPDEKVYKLLIESVKDYAIFMLDPAGRVMTWNTGAERIKGYRAEDIIGKYFSVFYPSQAVQEGFPQYELRKALVDGRFEDEGWRVRKDGTRFWANVVITAVFDEQKEHIGFSKVTRDLTERRKLEQELLAMNKALRESEARYRLIIESVNDYAIIMLDPAGRVMTWNTGAERIKGYRAEDIIGKYFSVFYPSQAVQEGFPQYELRKALVDGRFEDEGWRVRKDGTRFWAHVVVTAVFDEQKEHIGFSKITRDLTEHIRNEELRNKNQELLRINTDLDNFIYTASHDLKAPIANLEGLVQLMGKRMQGKLSKSEEELLNLMSYSTLKLRQTIQNLAEIAKSQRDQEEKPESISIKAVWEDVKEEQATSLLEVSANIKEELSVDRFEFIRANLRSILYNLLSNAIKYRNPERPLEIFFSSWLLENQLMLSFKDNGLGLSPAQKTKLFSMFKRFHNHIEGTGIGLYIVKRIIENNKGQIEVQSELNQGTEFKIYFPLNKERRK